MLKDSAAIVGIGETAFAKRLDGSEKSLALARQDSLAREPLPLRPLLEEAVLTLAPQLDATGFDVRLDVPDEATVVANRHLLGLLVRNLVENACCHAARPRLDIALTGNRLEFRNTLSEPPPDDPTAPGARRPSSPGIGQGLFLVQRIAQATGWPMHTVNEGGQFCLSLEISP